MTEQEIRKFAVEVALKVTTRSNDPVYVRDVIAHAEIVSNYISVGKTK